MAIKLAYVKNGDPTELEDTIMNMLISNIDSSDYKTVIGIINEFSTKDTAGALRCFEFAFMNKIDALSDHELLEMILITVINCFIKDKSAITEYKQQNLQRFLDNAEKKFAKSLTLKCSSSAVTLLWNAGKSESKNNRFDESIRWFNLALHNLLQVNECDKAKIQRALQNCYINTGELDEAIKIYNSMSEQEKRNLITQYNMFKIYANKEDETNLLGCLKQMTTSSEKNLVPLLSLCATNTDVNSRVAIESMMMLFKHINTELDYKVSIPAALRCVIELILKDSVYTEYYETLLTLFKEAHKFAKDSKNIKDYRFNIDELEWFSAQAFNVSRDCLINGSPIYGDSFAAVSIDVSILSYSSSLAFY